MQTAESNFSNFVINPLVPEILFGEFLDENLGASSYKCQNKVRKAGK